MTLDQLLDTIYSELRGIFPDVGILDVGDRRNFRGRDFLEVELPLVTYSVVLDLDLSRVVDWYIQKDLANYTASIEEEIPYAVHLFVGVHSELEREADEMALKVLRAWGTAPSLGEGEAEFGCYLEGLERTDVQDTGVASRVLHYVGWVRLPGRYEQVPLVREIDYRLDPVICPRVEAELEEFSVKEEG